MNDTIFALSSGRPPAGVAVIRTSGPAAQATAVRLAGPLPPARQAALRTVREPASGEPVDDVLLLRFDSPASATGEDVVEYQCHGGRAVVEKLLAVLGGQPGLRSARPGEFTRRALANGRIDLTEAEGLADLVAAETESQRRAALLMAEGELGRRVLDWRERLVDLSAQAEAAIDYVGDEEETATDIHALTAAAARVAAEMATLLERPRAEPLRDGVRVVVAGPPNAGKSSLINTLAGIERAIVTPIAGTTRDTIEVPVVLGGVPFVLVDTAGLRESDDPVESIGIARAEAEAGRADILLWLGPAAAPDGINGAVIPLAAKCDLGSPPDEGRPAVSSVTGEGLADLVDRLVHKAGEILPGDGNLALNQRQAGLVAEAHAAIAEQTEDWAVLAAGLRHGVGALDRLTGRVGVEDMLDRLFSRFCLGK